MCIHAARQGIQSELPRARMLRYPTQPGPTASRRGPTRVVPTSCPGRLLVLFCSCLDCDGVIEAAGLSFIATEVEPILPGFWPGYATGLAQLRGQTDTAHADANRVFRKDRWEATVSFPPSLFRRCLLTTATTVHRCAWKNSLG